MIRIATAALFSKLAGEALSHQFQQFPCAAAGFRRSRWPLAASASPAVPPVRSPRDGGAHPLRALRFVREDALFRRTLICWMLMGFANLMMLPLRVEYLANPQYQHGADRWA